MMFRITQCSNQPWSTGRRNYRKRVRPLNFDSYECLMLMCYESAVGIVRLTIHQAKELDHTKSLSGDLNPLCKVFVGGNSSPIHTTPIMKHSNNPVWESPIEFICADKASSVITLQVIDDRDFLKDPVVGYMSVRLEDLLAAKKEAGKDWWPLSSCKSGRLRLSVEWKPLNMAGSLAGADQYRPPIGVVRLWIQKATDVKFVHFYSPSTCVFLYLTCFQL